jgi:hypothetical protein
MQRAPTGKQTQHNENPSLHDMPHGLGPADNNILEWTA